MKPYEWTAEELFEIDSILTDADKEFLASVKKLRAEQKKEYLRPKLHFQAPKGTLNDPNGLCRFNGIWHMFYQDQPGDGTGCNWGHAMSKDLLHWMDLPKAIVREKEKDCWSGMTLVEEDRVLAVYFGLGKGIMLAVSQDPYLIHWEKQNDGEPIIPIPTEEPEKSQYIVFDPCIFKNGDTYVVLSGKYYINEHSGRRQRQCFKFESKDLVNWEFKGRFIENDQFSLPDDDNACPYFVKCDGRHAMFSYSHFSGPKVTIGDYDAERNVFVATNAKHFTSTSSCSAGMLAPSAHTVEDGSVRLIFNVEHILNPGTAHKAMSLPYSVTLAGENKNTIAVDVADEVEGLRVPGSLVEKSGILLDCNREYIFEEGQGDVNELYFEFEGKNIPMIEIKLMMSEDGEEYSALRIFRQRGNCYYPRFCPGFTFRHAHETVVELDTTNSTRTGNVRVPDYQSFWLEPDEKLKVRVFMDRSVIDVFVNGQVAMSARVSPVSGDNKRVSVIAHGNDLELCKFESYKLSL